MTSEEKVAYIVAQTTCAMIEAMGMVAENQYRVQCGGNILYGDEAFDALSDKYGIHHNAVIGFFHHS